MIVAGDGYVITNSPLLGVQARGEDLSYSVAGDVGQSRGVRVHSVGDGTPAARAGIRRGDLLLAANGRPVHGIDDLQRVMVLSAKPELELSIWRGNGRHSLSARPERRQQAA